MGKLALLMKLNAWWTNFIALLKGEVAPTPANPADPLTVQYYLNCKGYWCIMDGIWDTKTKEVLKKFQAANGLDPDGAVGKLTWSKLSEGI